MVSENARPIPLSRPVTRASGKCRTPTRPREAGGIRISRFRRLQHVPAGRVARLACAIARARNLALDAVWAERLLHLQRAQYQGVVIVARRRRRARLEDRWPSERVLVASSRGEIATSTAKTPTFVWADGLSVWGAANLWAAVRGLRTSAPPGGSRPRASTPSATGEVRPVGGSRPAGSDSHAQARSGLAGLAIAGRAASRGRAGDVSFVASP